MSRLSQTGDYDSLFNPRQRAQSAPEAASAPIANSFPAPVSLPLKEATSKKKRLDEYLALDQWQPARGHTLTFIALFLFSIVLYFRPYELVPSLASYTSMAFFFGIMTLAVYVPSQFTLEGNLTALPSEIKLILLLTLAALLSMPLASQPGEAYTEFTDVLLKAIVIFIVLVNVTRTELRLKLLIWLAFAVSIYLSAYAVSDYMNGVFREGSEYNNNQRIGGAIRGLFGNSNDLALHLVTMVPLAVGFAFASKGVVRKVLYIGLGVLFVAAVVVTFSRGGFIGLFIAALVLVRKLGRQNKLLSTSALVVAMLALLSLAPASYSSRLSTIFSSASDATGSSSQRTEILKRSIWVTLRYPLYGVGVGNFHYKSVHELVTHNAYTQVSSEMGIPALVVYVMLMLYPMRRLRAIEMETQNRPDKRKFHYWSIGIQVSIVAYMVSSFFGSVAYQWYVYYLVGYAVALRRLYYLDKNGEQNT
ncbi:MAG TPA: O-antigen ligase family protein [Pyrinomonadaceae bacterium]|nr:O-antigen ligase family protein [Pyrinomonadaceae bacterium]